MNGVERFEVDARHPVLRDVSITTTSKLESVIRNGGLLARALVVLINDGVDTGTVSKSAGFAVELEIIVLKATSKIADDRHQTAKELVVEELRLGDAQRVEVKKLVSQAELLLQDTSRNMGQTSVAERDRRFVERSRMIEADLTHDFTTDVWVLNVSNFSVPRLAKMGTLRTPGTGF